MSKARKHVGIETRHNKLKSGERCPAEASGKCRCNPSYRAEVYSRIEGKRVRQTFGNFTEAKAWRDAHLGAETRSRLRSDPGPTFKQAATDWLDGARARHKLNRTGESYKPSALRGYEQALRLRVYPELGGHRLRDITKGDLQRFVAKISKGKTTPSTVRNTLLPVRVIFRDAVDHDVVDTNPTVGLKLPADRATRDNIATRDDARGLIAAAPERDRALWATALYAGLRLGELRALRWQDVDFSKGVIRVQRNWDPKAGPVAPKSKAGARSVPMPKALRHELKEHQKRATATAADALVFGSTADKPFTSNTPPDRAKRAWQKVKLTPLGLHDCRHTYASLMIDADVNAKALSTYMGHATISITMDRYGHLMPGNESEAAKRFDTYLSNGA